MPKPFHSTETSHGYLVNSTNHKVTHGGKGAPQLNILKRSGFSMFHQI